MVTAIFLPNINKQKMKPTNKMVLSRKRFLKGTAASVLALAASGSLFAQELRPDTKKVMKTSLIPTIPPVFLHTVEADGVNIFYRESGPADAPVLLLLHGYPTSSHMFRNLFPRLASSYRLIAPDLPGFGFTEVPAARKYRYSFDNLAVTVNAFVEALGLKRYAIYVFDYGAPTGFRLALSHPERVTAIISQNGNAYEEGLGDAWNPIQRYWHEPTQANRDALRQFVGFEGTRFQYEHGTTDPAKVAPEAYWLDAALLQREGNTEIQLDLFLDYANNLKLYPSFQEYFRKHQPPLLAVWGKNDPFFIPAGAKAYQRDIPAAKVVLYDTGHFALETHVEEISSEIWAFLGNLG
jgi:pimeloyl-ACP methyl ester carboxylesterase